LWQQLQLLVLINHTAKQIGTDIVRAQSGFVTIVQTFVNCVTTVEMVVPHVMTNRIVKANGKNIVQPLNGFAMIVQNSAENAAVAAPVETEETAVTKDNVEFLKCHKVVSLTDKKHNQELGHGLFLSKVQADSISVVVQS